MPIARRDRIPSIHDRNGDDSTDASAPMDHSHGDSNPHFLRPYIHHGVDFTIQGSHAVADCPFCGKSGGKFSVDIATGLWRCFVCGGNTDSGGGNALTFIRILHSLGIQEFSSDFAEEVARDRRLYDPTTVLSWGVVRSPIPPHPWLLPGYSLEGKLDQLYKQTPIPNGKGGWTKRLLLTPGVWPEGKCHAIHAPVHGGQFNTTHNEVYICEGPWDGMALGEMLGFEGKTIIAVPGCKTWREEWSTLCKGKIVTLLYDSDHPRHHAGRDWIDGYDGMCRIARKLSGIAAALRWVKWGDLGYDPTRPTGWDVRDHLTLDPLTRRPLPLKQRKEMLTDLLNRIQQVPSEWFSATSTAGSNGSGAPDVEPEDCDNWRTCEAAWKKALEWREELSQVLATMLAVAASTNQSGDNQLFLQVIGDPGSAKTRLCKGLLVSKRCKLLLHLKSFHSGFKVPGDDERDCSLVARINGLCLITPEADALQNGMNLDQINSQVRQIFDGESGSTYGNRDKDNHYKGLRSPWIQAGTPILMDKDQSRLGDRFLRIRISQPDEDVKRSILRQALRNERAAVVESSNGTATSIIPPKLRKAYALTGGYVDWLRTYIEDKIPMVEMSDDMEEYCIDLAFLTADCRARPNMDPKKMETHHSKELPTRLTSQFTRLALSLAVTLNKEEVDSQVMRIVAKVALDTSYGHTINIINSLYSPNPKAPGQTYQSSGGIGTKIFESWLMMSEERTLNYLLFLRKIDILELRTNRIHGDRWLLTERVYDLYDRIMQIYSQGN